MIWEILGGILLKKAKRFLSLVLLVSVLMSTLFANPVGAVDDYAKYFTVESLPATRMVKDTTFTYKLTPKNPKYVLTLVSENPKIVQVVSNVKKGSSYYCTIKAVGEMGQVCQMWVHMKDKDTNGSEAINYIIIKESKQAEAKRQAYLREQESYEPANGNYFSVINDPVLKEQKEVEAENDNSKSHFGAHFTSYYGDPIPEEFSVPQGTYVTLSFRSYDSPVGGKHNAPEVAFSNPSIIEYNTSEYYNRSTKESSKEIGTVESDRVTRTIHVTAKGKVGESTQITVESLGHPRTFALTIGEKNSKLQGKGIVTSTEKAPHIKGLYGITEIGQYDVYNMLNVGVLSPLRTPYNPSFTYEEQLRAISSNLTMCWLQEGRITFSAASAMGYRSDAYVTQKVGKYGLTILRWREFKKEGRSTTVDFYNSVLNIFCYLANDKKTGEALWKWMDDSYTNGGGIDTNDYGFVDDSDSTDGHWNMTFKRSGAKVEVVDEGISTTFYFTPKQ